MTFFPENARAPDTLTTDEFTLRPLGPQYAEVDYKAMISSKKALRHSVLARHDLEKLTLEENTAALKAHEQEHRACRSFAFTVLTLDTDECLGCVYIIPLKPNLELVGAGSDLVASVADDEAVVGFWVRQSRLTDDLDVRLHEALVQWFAREWPFSRVSFYADQRDTRQVQWLRTSGLSHRFTIQVPSDNAHAAVQLLIFG